MENTIIRLVYRRIFKKIFHILLKIIGYVDLSATKVYLLSRQTTKIRLFDKHRHIFGLSESATKTQFFPLSYGGWPILWHTIST